MKKITTLLATLLVSTSVIATDTTVPSLNDFPPGQKLFDATEIVSIKTTSFSPEGSMASIQGDVIGLEYAPAGDYRVRITNGNGYKAERFSLMTCTLKRYLEDMDQEMTDSIPLSTAFSDKEGEVYNLIGYYSGTRAYPSDGYKVIITNGKNVQFWNSMNCRIK